MAAKKKRKTVRKVKAPARPRGRPTVYTTDLADEICRRLADGESLRAICRDAGMPPYSTVQGWALDDFMGFGGQYTRARQIQAAALYDELLEITDAPMKSKRDGQVNTADIQLRRLKVDTRKWALCKMLPKLYGDKLALGGDPDAPPITLSAGEVEKQIEALFAEVKKGSKKKR